MACRLRWFSNIMMTSLPRTQLLRLSLSLVLAVAGGALTGCGSNSISVDELPSELERRACARAVACGGAESQTVCESTVFIAQDWSVLTVVAGVKRGTIKYDGASARVCLDAIDTDCGSDSEPAACDNVFRGTVPAGGACVIDGECVNRGRCLKPDTCTVACCVGTCEAVGAPIAIGGACDYPFSAHRPRRRRLLRQSNVHGAPPGRRRVRERPGTSAPDPAVCLYRPDGSGETCTVISTEPGAACVPGANFGCGRDDETCDATTSLCTKRAAPGGACQTYGDCVGYAYCDTAAGTCKARVALGQACDVSTGVECVGGLHLPERGLRGAPARGGVRAVAVGALAPAAMRCLRGSRASHWRPHSRSRTARARPTEFRQPLTRRCDSQLVRAATARLDPGGAGAPRKEAP